MCFSFAFECLSSRRGGLELLMAAYRIPGSKRKREGQKRTREGSHDGTRDAVSSLKRVRGMWSSLFNLRTRGLI